MISILIPIFNGIEFIDSSVSSVINQSYTDWELIIGVNGHEKNSDVYAEAKKIEQISDKIKVIDLFYIKGKSNALNKMLDYCSGGYIALLDVDDIWHPNKLAVQSQYLNIFHVIGTKCVYFGDLENIVPNIPVGDISNHDFKLGNPIINSSSIIRKELCHWEENGIEDYDLWLKLRMQGKKFYNCDNILVRHRIHRDSAFNSKGHHNKVDELIKKYT